MSRYLLTVLLVACGGLGFAGLLSPCASSGGNGSGDGATTGSPETGAGTRYPNEEVRAWAKREPTLSGVSWDASLDRRALVTDAELRTREDGSQTEPSDKRHWKVLQEMPFVEVDADKILYRKGGGSYRDVMVARAEEGEFQSAHATVVVPSGAFTMIAHSIHYRANPAEVILEGDPIIRAGSRRLSLPPNTSLVRVRLEPLRITAGRR